MSVVGSQQQTLLRLLQALRPHWRRDYALPARIQALFAQHKQFGARDRRLYRELIYTTLRYLPWIEPLLDTDGERATRVVAWLSAETRDTQRFRAELTTGWPAPGGIGERAAFLGAEASLLLPPWIAEECPALLASPELDAQLQRAALWLRVQTPDPRAMEAEFAAKDWTWQPSPVLPDAWHVLVEADVTKSDAFAAGAFEVQDLGSQMLLESVGIASGGRWLDACAGAGGKTLQLARLLGPKGRVDAHDIRAQALDELRNRVARARVATVRTGVHSATERYDGVLIDAPCSGSGTWRRSPHLKWLTPADVLRERSRLQRSLLDRYAANVRPGGRLVYATCSLARTENETVVMSFLQEHSDYRVEPFVRTFGFEPSGSGLTVLPSRHNTDAFFVASLRRA